MNQSEWNLVVSAIADVRNSPSWLNEIATLSYEDAFHLPKFENANDGELTVPWADTKIVAADYLDFLREQIRIDARGPEWKELLQARLRALEPFVGKNVLTVTFHKKPHAVTLKIDPETGSVFHVETY